jgi:hypothetical protein
MSFQFLLTNSAIEFHECLLSGGEDNRDFDPSLVSQGRFTAHRLCRYIRRKHHRGTP